MAHIIDHNTFRVMKACREIEHTNSGILSHVQQLRCDAIKVGQTLQEAGRVLEDALVEFAQVQQRLSLSQDEHARIMQMVDEIMAQSPVFQALAAESVSAPPLAGQG
ncbi:hypothetical protein [Novispirillum itersonii]|uniref:hypothetical protein n=1 Tax=Novispirillum itersonii TaxID=189 RepID=UPI000361676D|nr:hypothetical protein [Novispirillum itersonii]